MMATLRGRTVSGTFVHAPAPDTLDILADALVTIDDAGLISAVVGADDPDHARLRAEAGRGGRLVATPPGSMVLPGFVETEGFPQRTKLRSPFLRRFVIEANDVAKAVVRAVERNKGEVTLPWFPYRLVSIAQALLPGLVHRIAARATAHRDE